MRTIRAQLLTAFALCATLTVLAMAVGVAGLYRLESASVEISRRSWPTADACMEFWIATLAKERARHHFDRGSREAARRQLDWSKKFDAHALDEIAKAGELAPTLLGSLVELSNGLDVATDDFVRAEERTRALASVAVPSTDYEHALRAARRDLADADARAEAIVDRIEAVIEPEERHRDLMMDAAGAVTVRSAQRWKILMVAVGASGLASALGIALFLAHRIVNPLHRLAEVARQLGRGDLDAEVGFCRVDEIGQLGASVDEMAANLRRSRDDLIASESRYRELFEFARHGMAIVDETGRIVEINDSFAAMIGVEREARLGAAFEDLLAEPHRESWPETAERIVAGDTPLVEVDLLRSDGTTVPVNISGLDLPDRRRTFVVADLRQRRSMEQALIQGEKMGAVGQLAAGVAHELRNPLFVISNVLYEIKDTIPHPSPIVLESLAMAEEENRRARGIIDNLLEFSRRAPPGTTAVELEPAIRQVGRLFRAALADRRIDLALDLSGSTRCRCEPDAIKHVLVNLVANAIDAMPDGGTLTISTEETPAGTALLRVRDSGQGIAPEAQRHVFNPFFTTKRPGRGIGLGLWIVHSTVERFGGRIDLTSAEGQGTSFTIELPLAREAA